MVEMMGFMISATRKSTSSRLRARTVGLQTRRRRVCLTASDLIGSNPITQHQQVKKRAAIRRPVFQSVVEMMGFEPTTPTLRRRPNRSPLAALNDKIAPFNWGYKSTNGIKRKQE